MALTLMQRAFVDAMMTTWQPTAAARIAGFKFPNRAGARLMKKPEIQAAIEARLEKSAMRADEALARLAEQARVNIGDFVEKREDGGFDLNWVAIKDRGHLIKKLSMTRYGPTIELHDGQTALLNIGRHLRLFQDVNMNVDLTKLSDEQLEKLAKGEDVLAVIANSGSS